MWLTGVHWWYVVSMNDLLAVAVVGGLMAMGSVVIIVMLFLASLLWGWNHESKS